MVTAWGARLNAQSEPDASPVTIAIFSDRPLPAGQWSALKAAIESERTAGVPAQAHIRLQILRGDAIAPGIVVDQSISVFLHGNCVLIPRTTPSVSRPATGALGWTKSTHGQLESFAHIDCNRITQLLAPRISGMNRDERDQAMSVAIAHVLLHEWSHIATQSAHHSEHGLTKSTFNARDLMVPLAEPLAQLRQP
jgi:hypothetical protein